MTACAPARRLSEDNRADLLVALVVALALAAGWIYKTNALSQTAQAADPNSGLTLQLPAYWLIRQPGSVDTFLTAENPRADSIFKSSVVGQSFLLDPESPTPLGALVDRLVRRRGEELLGYHLLDIRSELIAQGAAEARLVEYAYVVQPIDQPFRAAVPVVVHAVDYVIYTPTEYWLLTFAADEQRAADELPVFEQIVRSIRLP